MSDVHSAGKETGKCGIVFARHPTQPHLAAVCTRPPNHDGDHDNLLPASTRDPEEES